LKAVMLHIKVISRHSLGESEENRTAGTLDEILTTHLQETIWKTDEDRKIISKLIGFRQSGS